MTDDVLPTDNQPKPSNQNPNVYPRKRGIHLVRLATTPLVALASPRPPLCPGRGCVATIPFSGPGTNLRERSFSVNMREAASHERNPNHFHAQWDYTDESNPTPIIAANGSTVLLYKGRVRDSSSDGVDTTA